jgi:hypothetical protein
MVIRVDFSKCLFNHFKVFEEMGFEAAGAITAFSIPTHSLEGGQSPSREYGT